jgi:ATP-dependent Clp protease protease subunit
MTTSSKTTMPYGDHVSYILSDLRRINLFGSVDGGQYSHIENSLAYMTKVSPKPITIIMHTPGGSVIDGLAIYDTIRRFGKKHTINIHVAGAAMSMGIIILQAASGLRTSAPNASFLLHEVNYGGDRQTVSIHEDTLVVTRKLQARLDDIVVGRSGIKLDELKRLTKRKDYAINAVEALEHNLIDEIIE